MNALEVKAKINIPLDDKIIKKGTVITVSKREHDYILYDSSGWYSLDKEYVGKTIRVICES